MTWKWDTKTAILANIKTVLQMDVHPLGPNQLKNMGYLFNYLFQRISNQWISQIQPPGTPQFPRAQITPLEFSQRELGWPSIKRCKLRAGVYHGHNPMPPKQIWDLRSAVLPHFSAALQLASSASTPSSKRLTFRGSNSMPS